MAEFSFRHPFHEAGDGLALRASRHVTCHRAADRFVERGRAALRNGANNVALRKNTYDAVTIKSKKLASWCAITTVTLVSNFAADRRATRLCLFRERTGASIGGEIAHQRRGSPDCGEHHQAAGAHALNATAASCSRTSS